MDPTETFGPLGGTPKARREKIGRTPYDLVPFQEIADAYSRVAEHGAVKYAPWNWAYGLKRTQLLASLLRHVFAYQRGQDRDDDSGLSHLDHILWNSVALVHADVHGFDDDRRRDPKFDPYSSAPSLPSGSDELQAVTGSPGASSPPASRPAGDAPD